MKNIWSKSLICGFIISILCSFVNFSGKCEGISDKVLRLHIIANSDSFEDQSLKLKVRDRILKDFGVEASKVNNMDDAEILVQENLERIKFSAQDEILRNGFNYDVNVELINMHFNTRVYTDVTLPAGNYDALRVTIGEAKGKNWWCVMFPPMCLPAAERKREISEVLDESESKIVTNFGDYQIEFKIVEIFSQVKDFVQNNICNPVKKYLYDEDNFEYGFSFSFENSHKI